MFHTVTCTGSFAVHRVNGMKGSIYMVFDYMDHDLTGLMEREGHRFTIPQVSLAAASLLSLLLALHVLAVALHVLFTPVCLWDLYISASIVVAGFALTNAPDSSTASHA